MNSAADNVGGQLPPVVAAVRHCHENHRGSAGGGAQTRILHKEQDMYRTSSRMFSLPGGGSHDLSCLLAGRWFLFVLLFCIGATAAFGQLPPPVKLVGNPHLGSGVHFSQGRDYRKLLPIIEKSGLGWIRDEIGWESTERQKGVYRISENTLAWVHAVHEHHLRLL